MPSPSDGMVDIQDLKSWDRKVVRVRVSPWVFLLVSWHCWGCTEFGFSITLFPFSQRTRGTPQRRWSGSIEINRGEFHSRTSWMNGRLGKIDFYTLPAHFSGFLPE
jgi:hypothetical protein